MVVYARKILAVLKDAEDASARLQRAEIGVLTVGMVSTAKYFMMRMLADFRARHAGVDIRICTGNREQLIKMLQNNEVDIAVMGQPPSELQTRAEPFAAHPHVFVAACDHPLVERDKLSAEDLRPYEFIVREQGSGTRAAMHKFFSDRRVEPRLQLQVNSNETLKQAVMAGLGIGFVSLHTIGLELDHAQIAVLDVQGSPVFRVWNLVHTLSKVLSPAAEAFRYEMLERGEQFLAAKYGHHISLP
jgi:DNA-binding transcriptional LysR family regulator